jgi:hypothetical protein
MRKLTTAQLRKTRNESLRALNAREARGCGCNTQSYPQQPWCAACNADVRYLESL